MNRRVAAVMALVGICAVQTVTAATASAHAELVSSSPADGAMLVTLPDVVELVFSENVGKPADVVGLAPDGDPVPSGELTVVDDTAALPLEAESTQTGTYTISYQVTSADGHAISGFTTFMVHADGSSTDMTTGDASSGSSSGAGGSSGEADGAVVALLAGGLAVALAVALVTLRRLIAGSDEIPAT